MAIEVNSATAPAATSHAPPKRVGIQFPRLGQPRLTGADRMFFTEQLSLMLDSGVTLLSALNSMRRHTKREALKLLVGELAEEVTNGRALSSALAKHPEVFSSSYVNLVAASEAGGFMSTVLTQIQAMEQRAERMRSTFVAAMFYPIVLALLSAAVTVFVLVVVFPKFDVIFQRIRDDLPLSTQVLLALSESLSQHWMLWAFGTCATLLGISIWIRSEVGVAILDKARIHLPILRQFFPKFYLVQAMRVLSLSLMNGVNITDALSACRDVVPNRYFRQFLVDVERSVHDGAGVASVFRRTDFVPSQISEMVETGEQAGSLAQVLGRLSEHYEEQLRRSLEQFSKLAEPAMLLVMGVLVGFLVSSLILPIFQVSRVVN